MIDTPPQAKPPQLPAGQSTASSGDGNSAPNGIPTITTQTYGQGSDVHMMDYTQTGPSRALEDHHPMAATAAVALAQLHSQRQGGEWPQDLGHGSIGNGHNSDGTHGYDAGLDRPRPHSSYELPPIQHQRNFPTSQPRGLLPSMLDHSPPGRSTTLPPIQDGTRPRNRSIGEQARVMKHQRKPSKNSNYARRMSLEGRKAYSVEPPGSDAFIAKTKRWEDLIEAATSIRGDESDRDLTPVRAACNPHDHANFDRFLALPISAPRCRHYTSRRRLPAQTCTKLPLWPELLRLLLASSNIRLHPHQMFHFPPSNRPPTHIPHTHTVTANRRSLIRLPFRAIPRIRHLNSP